ncbi:MAG: DNA polymerase I [Deltaproteobacteria bacterium]|nr:DNA polymerase I [Deltaproteobacteria bacterium]
MKKLFLIDGSSYLYRAFFAIPSLSNSKGFPTNAVYGFTAMLLKVVKDYQPDYLAVVFDSPGKTFRDELFKEYKAQRPPMPDAMGAQIPKIFEVIDAYRIPVLKKEGFEADDIIGTLVSQMPNDFEAIIITSDKDMMQLVSDRVTLLDTMKNKRCGIPEVQERFGVEPERVIEVLGLSGDATDNVPGIPGVGEKTAVQLIQQFGSLEKVLKAAKEISKPKLRENLLQFADQARLSRTLCTIDRQVPLEIHWKEIQQQSPDRARLTELFQELEFTRFLKELETEVPPEEGDPVQKIATAEEARLLIPKMIKAGVVVVVPMTLEGVVFCSGEKELIFSPIFREVFKDLFKEKRLVFWAPNAKELYHFFHSQGVPTPFIVFDPLIASYLLNESKSLSPASAQGDPVDQAAKDARETLRLGRALLPKLEEQGMSSLFHEIEMPLAHVLAKMELRGVQLDLALLDRISEEWSHRIEGLQKEIYELAGEEFNIDSPKQLRVILFDRLQLPKGKKTKTGHSTDVEVLTKLSEVHPLPAKILEYRSFVKLKGTYVDALRERVDPKTHRVHTTFHQTVAVTGRLSSSDPNLQNIPIRTPEGRRIRQAFVAEEGCELLAADYSQIELRILAHLSEDPALIEAFENDQDIHTRTSCELLGVTPDLVTSEMRRRAKVINFGIIYGMSPFGLSKELKIEPLEAQVFIDKYFERYPKVKGFIQGLLKQAQERGWVETMLGRRRALPDLKSPDYNLRSFAERGAINAPIQGSAADLIKLAMIRIDRELEEEGLGTKMILQVHDELVFEVPKKEKKKVEELVRRQMETVCSLKAPLRVSVGWGKNWDEAHG